MTRMPTARQTFLRPDCSDDEQLRTEERFFRELRLRNGTYKTTYVARMPELDDYCVSLAPHGEVLRLLDIGISSGVTSLELVRTFDRAGLRVELLATDLVIDGQLFRCAGCEVLLDSVGEVLQVAVGRFGRGRPHAPEAALRRRVLDQTMRLAGRVVRRLPFGPIRIPLVSTVLARRPDVSFKEADVFSFVPEWRGRFWLVRGANVLNYDYFPEERLRLAVRHLAQYVQPGGLLVLNRTVEPERINHGTVFRREVDGGLTVLRRFGNGSEVERLTEEARFGSVATCGGN